MNFDVDRLYNLLPAVHRVRDAKEGGPLRALLAVIAEQAAVIEEDLAQLEDNQFIETCAPWVVPYIGDLIGARGVYDLDIAESLSGRAQVANTVRHRRRKGTAAVMEELARDVTQWNARAVEFFQLLATTQAMNHLRPGNESFINIRDAGRLQWLNTPFERHPAPAPAPGSGASGTGTSGVRGLAHNAEVRRIAAGTGRYNIPNIGIFLWRLHAYPLVNTPAFELASGDRRFMFNPLGHDTQLFNFPRTETSVTHLARPINVPMPITRRMMHDNLSDYYGRGRSIVVTLDGNDVALGAVTVCDLSDQPGGGWAHQPQNGVAIDPQLGRLAIGANLAPAPTDVRVTFHYGFSADMGGGSYDRAASLIDPDSGQPSGDGITTVPDEQATVQGGLNNVAPDEIVEIRDSGRYTEPLSIGLAPGGRVTLRADDGVRPVVDLDDGEFVIQGGDEAEVTLNGLVIVGGVIRVPASLSAGGDNQLRRLRLVHCTLVPGRRLDIDGSPQSPDEPSLIVESPHTHVEIDRCIVGGLRVDEGADVRVTDSIVDATGDERVAYAALDGADPGGALEIQNSTVIGKVNARVMTLVSNTIFVAALANGDGWTSPVGAQQLQEGCVRFSYHPAGSRLPRCYRCVGGHEDDDEGDGGLVRLRFTSLRYGEAGYGQLAQLTSEAIRHGASDGAEMGAFHDLYQPQRLTNLRVRLDEYTRFAMETGVFLVT